MRFSLNIAHQKQGKHKQPKVDDKTKWCINDITINDFHKDIMDKNLQNNGTWHQMEYTTSKAIKKLRQHIGSWYKDTVKNTTE